MGRIKEFWRSMSIPAKVLMFVLILIILGISGALIFQSFELVNARKKLQDSEKEYLKSLDDKEALWRSISKEKKDSMYLFKERATESILMSEKWRRKFIELNERENEVAEIVAGMDSTELLDELKRIRTENRLF